MVRFLITGYLFPMAIVARAALFMIVLSICFSDYPATEPRPQRDCHLRTPLVQRVAFDHIPKLRWRDP